MFPRKLIVILALSGGVVAGLGWFLISDAPIQLLLGNLYDSGVGDENKEAAAMWYLKAAEQGDVEAQYRVGLLYDRGDGVKRDYRAAREWYLKAAAQGEANAQNNLGSLYRFAQGGKLDYPAAREWYLKAAAQGSYAALNNLGHLYEQGQGVKQDYQAARWWYLKRAVQHWFDSQYDLGRLYENGHGMPKDPVTAGMWYRLAAEESNANASAAWTKLKKTLSPVQRKEVTLMCENWKSEHPALP